MGGAIDRPETLAYVSLMEAYALSCEQPGACRTWRELCFARQVAIRLGYEPLRAWTRSTAKNRRAAINSEKDEAYMRLLTWDSPERGMAIPGLVGHYIAAQIADDAILNKDMAMLEMACHRLSDVPSERFTPANPFLEHVLYDTLCGEAHGQGFHVDRIRAAMKDAMPVFRQRVGMDIAALRDGITYGGR